MKTQFQFFRPTSAMTSVIALCFSVQAVAIAPDIEGDGLSLEETAPGEQSGQGDEADNATIDPALLAAPLEDLLVLEATSVAKKRQKVEDASAAVYVITQEEIRKSPAGTVVDLLRTVPGVEVGHINNGGIAVSIRGFNGRNSNALLVMIDGRSIYSSGLSGVFWDQVNMPLRDIERIEIVRGPGAALWGANAVNGVINIITKNSADTLGSAATARVGNRRQEITVTHGVRFNENLTLRAHGGLRRDEMLVDAQGNDIVPDAASSGEVGARLDWQASDRDAVTFQADYAEGHFANVVALFNLNPLAPGFDTSVSDDKYEQINVLARWSRRQSDGIDWRAQAYYSHLNRRELGIVDYSASTADIDIGVNWRVNATHDLSLGFAARVIDEEFVSFTPNADFGTDQEPDVIVSGYIQDDVSIIPDRLRLTVGAKLEHNNFTGFEFQPSARLFYRASEDVAAWASVSRAARTPSRFERSAKFDFIFVPAFSEGNPTPFPVFVTVDGNEDLPSEQLTAFEAGVRATIADGWSFDVSGYYNRYRRIVIPSETSTGFTFLPGIPFPVAINAQYQNEGLGRLKTWGVEALLKGQITEGWNAKLTYSHFNFDVATDPQTGVPYRVLLRPTDSPRHQFSLTNEFQLAENVQLTTQLRYVDEIDLGNIDSYVSGDFRLNYDFGTGLEFAVIGENLFQDQRQEFPNFGYPVAQSFNPRSVSAELRYRF